MGILESRLGAILFVLLSFNTMEVFVLASRRIHYGTTMAFLQPGRVMGASQLTRRHFYQRRTKEPTRQRLPHEYWESPKKFKRQHKKSFREGSAQTASINQQEDKPPEEALRKHKNKEKRYKKSSKAKQVFRAERVLANRSGKTRAECNKLLKKYAVSIFDEEEDRDTPFEYLDLSKLRVIAAKEQIPMNARIFINKKFEVPCVPPMLMVYHKPKWVLSTMGNDAKERKNLQNLKFSFRNRMHPVGRLDYDTSGLLLFSSSGRLTQHLLHPKFEKQKEYVAVVSGNVQEEELRERLQTGVELADIQTRGNRSKKTTTATTSALHEEYSDSEDPDAESSSSRSSRETFTTCADLLGVQHWPDEDVTPYLDHIRATLPEEYNVTDLNLRGYMNVFDSEALSEIRLVVTEGKHRMVRRLLASCGHPVVSLKRERLGVIELGDLPEGAFRNTTAEEEAWAESLVKS